MCAICFLLGPCLDPPGASPSLRPVRGLLAYASCQAGQRLGTDPQVRTTAGAGSGGGQAAGPGASRAAFKGLGWRSTPRGPLQFAPRLSPAASPAWGFQRCGSSRPRAPIKGRCRAESHFHVGVTAPKGTDGQWPREPEPVPQPPLTCSPPCTSPSPAALPCAEEVPRKPTRDGSPPSLVSRAGEQPG